MGFELPDPSVIIALLILALGFRRAVDILTERGRPIARSQQAWFWGGWLVTAVALIGPIDLYAADLLWVHMVQHILLADVAGPMLLMGLRSPVLVFLWPKAIMVPVAKNRVIRRAWSILILPPVALGVWLATLAAWHVPAAYELAHASSLAHTAQHASFVLTGALVWWPLIDPARHNAHGGVWKALYLILARGLAGVLAIVLIVAPPLYPSYAETAILYGTTARADQQLAGAIMMTVDFVMVAVIAIAFVLSSAPRYEEPRARL